MALYEAHIDQAKKNLRFLIETNSNKSVHWDWQVTTCFYVAVHLANAHLAKVANLHYRTHEDVKNAISPNPMSIGQLPPSIYLSYAKLEGLSRRSRYLCHQEPSNKEGADIAFFTYDKHFAKAIKNLDKVMEYFKNLYSIDFGKLEVTCSDLNSSPYLVIFSVKK